jgi:hypothetical protein
MPDTDGGFPADVPVADAVEQQPPTGESPCDDEEDATSRLVEDDVPLQASVSDWQQQESVRVIRNSRNLNSSRQRRSLRLN